MASERGVLHMEEVENPVTDWELCNAIAYVKENCKSENDQPIELELELLRILFDTARTKRRETNVVLPLHVARTVGYALRVKYRQSLPKYEGYKRGVMKIFADRSARSENAQDKKRVSLAETRRTGKKRKRVHPEDPRKKHRGQLVLLTSARHNRLLWRAGFFRPITVVSNSRS